MLQNPTKPEFAKLKDWVLQAQAKRQSACLLFAQAVSDEVCVRLLFAWLRDWDTN